MIRYTGMCVSIAIELMVEHANESPSFQGNSVDVGRPSKLVASEVKVTLRNCLTMCKMVSLTNKGEGARVGVGFLQNCR